MTEQTLGLISKISDPIRLHTERRRAEVTMHLLQLQRENLILDVGCGEGYQLGFVVKHSSQSVGIDISAGRLREGKKKVNKADFIRASCEKVPFRPKVFDKVMCLELLEHLRNPSISLSEIDSVLKSKGILIVSVPYKERIIMTQCIHCGKLTPLYGHLHSYDEKKISLLLKNYTILRMEHVGTILASYILFSPLPNRIWRILDALFRHLPSVKPSWLVIKVQKP